MSQVMILVQIELVNIVVLFDFIERALFMAKETPLAVGTEQLLFERGALFGLVLGVQRCVSAHEFIVSMRELALVAVPAAAHFDPVLAHLRLKLRLIHHCHSRSHNRFLNLSLLTTTIITLSRFLVCFITMVSGVLVIMRVLYPLGHGKWHYFIELILVLGSCHHHLLVVHYVIRVREVQPSPFAIDAWLSALVGVTYVGEGLTFAGMGG